MIEKELEEKVLQWAKAKGILDGSTFEKQMLKCVQEVGELAEAVEKNNRDEIQLELGDVVVCLINASHFAGGSVVSAENYLLDYPSAEQSLFALAQSVADYSLEGYFTPYDSINHVGTLAKRYGLTPNECLAAAYDKISKRSGQLIDGIFVKDVEAK